MRAGPARPEALGPAVALAVLAGVLLAFLSPVFGGGMFWGPLLALGVAGWLGNGPRRCVGAMLVGFALAHARGEAAMVARLPAMDAVDVTGRIVGLPVRAEDALRFELEVVEAGAHDAVPRGARLQLAWFSDGGGVPPDLAPGEIWRFGLRLRPPRGLANPGGFDAERRALAQGLAATGYVRSPGQARRLAGGQGVDAYRARASARIVNATAAPGGRFVRALALGDTRGLDEGDWQVLRTTGLTHLIAISGFHVGLVAGFAALLARLPFLVAPALARACPRPHAAAFAAMAAAAGYTALAGFALPTVRTLLMISAVALARLLRRGRDVTGTLALAAIAVLLADPLAVLAPGFWLSFLGVAWLLWCLPDAAAPGVGPLLRAQGVATLGLLPVSAVFFLQASLVGPLANLVGIPWISLGVVPLSLLGLALDPLHAGAAALAWSAAAAMMDGFWRGLAWTAAWPGALAWLAEAPPAAAPLALAGAFWLLLPRGTPGKGLALLLWLPLLWPRIDRPGEGEADLVQLDVGQGLAVLVRTRGHALLFDAGPASPRGYDAGEAVVVPALRALGVRRLDLAIASHRDSDHAGGFAAVMAALPADQRLAPRGAGVPGTTPCVAGQRWRWDGVEFEILHPTPGFPYLGNDSSCVLRVRAAGAVALLPGDIGRHVEARLARGGGLGADVLLVPHHGSDSGSSLDFLAATRPAWALASVGHGNRFGLPRPVVLARYQRYGADWLDSATEGAIRLRLGPGGVELRERHRRDRPRPWRPAEDGPGYAIGGPEPHR